MTKIFMNTLIDGAPIGSQIDISDVVRRLDPDEMRFIESDIEVDGLANASYLALMRVLPLHAEAFSSVVRASDICEDSDRRFDIRLYR